MADDFDLQRFVAAQDAGGSYDRALAELEARSKQGHWRWWIFPQLAGLGRTATAQAYGISGLPEARAYLAHPVLGERLVRCARALVGPPLLEASTVLGHTDALKLRSSMTLFALADPDEPVFGQVLEQYYGGRPDELTHKALREGPAGLG